MWILIVFFIAGIVTGRWLRSHKGFLRVSSIMGEVCVNSLLFILGYLLGTDPHIISNLSSLGTDAILLSLFAIIGSIVFTLPLGRWIK